MAKTYNYTKLTGGTDGCLDALTDAIVEDGDFALGVVSGVQYSHYFDADSTAAASSPDVIEPISGSGRWLIAPSTTGYATAAEITAGTEDEKAIAPDQLKLSSPTFADISVSNLTASSPVFTDANKKQVSKSAADLRTFLGGTASRVLAQGAAGDLGLKTGAEVAVILAGALTANNKLFVNAAGTGLENSSGLQLVATTFDMSTDTGSFNVSCNFKPSLIECRTFIVGTNTSSDGTYSGGTELVKAYNPAASAWTQTAKLAWAMISGTAYQLFSVSKLSDSKITIANTKTGSPTGTLQIHLRLFR
jgi:hypothetical protein